MTGWTPRQFGRAQCRRGEAATAEAEIPFAFLFAARASGHCLQVVNLNQSHSALTINSRFNRRCIRPAERSGRALVEVFAWREMIVAYLRGVGIVLPVIIRRQTCPILVPNIQEWISQRVWHAVIRQ